jgi:CBS-domain-containing membrane protein
MLNLSVAEAVYVSMSILRTRKTKFLTPKLASQAPPRPPVAGAPTLPLAQPRNVIGGQLISAVVGVLVGTFSHSLWAAAIAGGLALGAMLATRTSHSPAAATAVLGTLATSSKVEYVILAGLAVVVLVAVGWIRSALTKKAYPTYWW